MRRLAVILGTASSLVFAGPAHAEVSGSVSLNLAGLPNFRVTVGDYFRVPEREVIIVQQSRIPEEQVPVVFYVAQQARVAPAAVIQLRNQGLSWNAVTLHFGLSPEIFYVPVSQTVVVGPPYGHAYGHFKNKPRSQWKTLVLADDDVTNLVNLRVLSTGAGVPPERVIQLRSKGQSFIAINDQVKPKQKKVKAVSQPKVKAQQVQRPQVKAQKVRQSQVKANRVQHKQVKKDKQHQQQAKVRNVHQSQMKVHNARVAPQTKAQKVQHSQGGKGKGR